MSFKEISPEQAWEMMQKGAILADVRDPQRFTYSHAKGAFHSTKVFYNLKNKWILTPRLS